MKLEKVIESLKSVQVKGTLECEIKGVCHDSRHFQPGDLFVAIRGNQFDGHLFVPAACDRGAPAILLEDDRVVPMRYTGTVIKTKDSRRAIDTVASNFYGRPSEKLCVIGVTGTNGKTTTAHMIETVLNSHKIPTAVIGTIDTHFGEKKIRASHTTPDALETQKLLSDWLAHGAQAVSMEVSSHALALARVDSVQFDIGVFTNLTRDHLDFHKTMDEYIRAKALFFQNILKKSSKKKKRAIMNAEDPHFRQLFCDAIPTWTYGFEIGDIKATNLDLSFQGTGFEVITSGGKVDMQLPMIGKHNVLNALAAIGVGLEMGVSLVDLASSLGKLHGVSGRMERVSGGSPVNVFVDYAHSDDALRNVLGFLKNIRDEKSPKSRIITVFGCGGDRDRGKRPSMMQVVQNFSDLCIVTSDNPRTEDPEKIIEEILKGANPILLQGDAKIVREVDRRKAIELAIKESSPGDVVLIAGKGHENYQIIGTRKHHFDDVEIAKEILSK